MSEGLFTEEEVKSYLELESPQLDQLVHRGKLTAYRVGGSFVRFRKEEVIALKSGRKFRMPDQFERSWFEKARDFWAFYRTYILLSLVVILAAVYFAKV